MKGSKSSGAPLTNTANRVKPQGGANLGHSSPGTEGLGNTANRALTPSFPSSPDFGAFGTVTKGAKAPSGKGSVKSKSSPGI